MDISKAIPRLDGGIDISTNFQSEWYVRTRCSGVRLEGGKGSFGELHIE